MLWKCISEQNYIDVMISVSFIFLGVFAFLNTIPFNKPISLHGIPISPKYYKLNVFISAVAISLLLLGHAVKFIASF
ncbi:hypothetical protein CSQ89_12170 [Chitinimonas sp. BJB300]|nr:hypothetical protein CSQ89_12170 [Chitinimonas sp. BJB300]